MTQTKNRRTKRRPIKTPRMPGVTYTVSDGELVLVLETCEEGGYCVTSPFDPALITQADTLEEAFEMARDAAQLLREARTQLQEERREGRRAKARASL
jgi:antitoxin HicB